ncbi:MAG: cell division protein FtsL [Suilimivivens sp.]
MAENRRRTTYTAGNARSQRSSAYVYGNTARKLQVVPDEYERPVRKVNHAPRKNRERALHMNVGYVLFLASALLIVGFVLTSYLTLKSEITSSVKQIARLESELNNMKLDNDERESRISSNMNLEEVRQTAIQELGMQYAGEGQIITFNSEDNDYVIQKGEIPD